MPLFQESIIKKYLATLDQGTIESAYTAFKQVYSSAKIQNIRTAKEEQYQEGFIKDIFGTVLGYAVYPEHPYNIETEKKNETNSKKADGAILKDEKVVGVIELKDNKTKNLDAVKDQAFAYKNNHKECSYVISSNFHKLRFYIDDATDYEEFDLYSLDKETFRRFYLYLRKEGLLDKNLPKLLREETKFHEEEISKKLYKDYSQFKRSFFENAVKNNPQHDKLLLFKKSQKFLDRVLFLLFAEDKGLVGTNSIVKIVEKWAAADDDYYRPLYELVNVYFGHLFRGYIYQRTGEEIPEFGGELFAPDDVLDNLKIDDAILKNDLLVLSKYDFNTDVDVNILGHIFEHSLNEVDDVEAELRGEVLDKTKSKRKKDGVFYTPKYITKYIVDNTLGKLCAEKKAEMKLDEDIFIFEYKKADGKLNDKGKDLFDRLNAYKAWLLTLKVCDPACGSGAFLNQALSFFIEEHQFADDIIAELTDTPLRLFDTDLQILENNIYGVDINDESVEIAKLSLWLRTARPGRKLSNLSNNIKCGNSLIDDPVVAGDKAFNWQKEFPQVFDNGGFDVVIGNPPYVRPREIEEIEKTYLLNNYSAATNQFDLYHLFIAKIKLLLNAKGNASFIVPNAFLSNENSKDLRLFILDSFAIRSIVDCKQKVFEDASVESMIFCFDFDFNSEFGNYFHFNDNQFWLKNKFSFKKFRLNKNFIFSANIGDSQSGIMNKIKVESSFLSDFFKVMGGIKEYQIGKGKPPQTKETKEKSLFNSKNKLDNTYFPEIRGKHLYRYGLKWENDFISYGSWLAEPRDIKYFLGEKLLIRQIPGKNNLVCSYTPNDFIVDQTAYSIKINELQEVSYKYAIALLNSKLMFWYFRNENNEFDDLFPKIKSGEIKSLPIKKTNKIIQKEFEIMSDKMLELNQHLQEILTKFQTLIESDFCIEKISKKLEEFYQMPWKEFEKELIKNKITLLGVQKEDWLDRFERFKKQALDLKSQIDQTDKEIDHMVYELYGLTEEEIKIVEAS